MDTDLRKINQMNLKWFYPFPICVYPCASVAKFLPFRVFFRVFFVAKNQ